MYLKKVELKNFRLWNEALIDLEKQSTVIVGKNNTGKSSFMYFMLMLVNNQTPFFNDYPLDKREDLYNNILKFLNGEIEFKELSDSFILPSVKLYVDYSLEKDDENLGALVPFIIDTDISVSEAIVKANYALVVTEEQFKNIFEEKINNSEQKKQTIKKILDKEFSNLIKLNFYAINPVDGSKNRKVEYKEFKNLFPVFTIKAERSMDESDASNKAPLQAIITQLFKPQLDDSLKNFEEPIKNLKKLCEQVNADTEEKVNELLNDITKDSLKFGYPTSEDLQFLARSRVELENQIQDSVDIHYQNMSNKETLPSTYNGLGYKNLLKIELQLLSFANQIKDYIDNSIPLVFIEEPESHMHPQMQQRFIEYIDQYCKEISETKDLQIIITTHSSHIVNSTNFERIRYLKKEKSSVIVKNLNNFCIKQDSNKEFLEKYLTLNKCDLFFADKAILIEGTAERLLIPNMIEKLYAAGKFSETKVTLQSQYYTLIEVGGAYAFKFIPFMKFLDIPTLIITDIDSISEDCTKCYVSKAKKTSNATIKHWFTDILNKSETDYTFNDIKSLNDTDKSYENIHLEYQIEENGLCGRSLEEAIKNANRQLFSINENPKESDIDYNPSKDGSKTDFAMNLIFEENKRNYSVPKYIENGLIWLNRQHNGR